MVGHLKCTHAQIESRRRRELLHKHLCTHADLGKLSMHLQSSEPPIWGRQKGVTPICSDLFRFPRFLPICSDLRSSQTSNPCFFRFPCFFCFLISLAFFVRFPFLFQGLEGFREEKNPSDLRSLFSGMPRFLPICSDLLRFVPICSDLSSEQIRTNQGNPFLPTPFASPRRAENSMQGKRNHLPPP